MAEDPPPPPPPPAIVLSAKTEGKSALVRFDDVVDAGFPELAEMQAAKMEAPKALPKPPPEPSTKPGRLVLIAAAILAVVAVAIWWWLTR